MSLALGDRARRRRFLGAARLQVVDRLALAAGEDGQRPALLDDVLRHAVAHEPDADEADALFHMRFLLQNGDLFRRSHREVKPDAGDRVRSCD